MATKHKILIVDDETDMVYGLKLQLEAEGLEVITASDGIDGLTKAHQENPDLVILDVMMPELDGYNVCAKLKGDKEKENIPILMLTVRSSFNDGKKAYDMGADVYLTKPYEPAHLIKKVKQLLAGKK